MDKDTLYYHFANLGLVLIGLISIYAILGPFITVLLLAGTITGFFVSWQIRETRPQYVDIFIGMLSLLAVIIIVTRVYDIAITFENLLRIFSTTLAWLTLFQSFGLRTGKSYAMLQFISVCLLISSVSLALQQEIFYITLLPLFLFTFIFTMRLNLMCERKRKGSLIIGDQEDLMSLPQQIKVTAIMFSFVLISAGFIYPLVPRFANVSLKIIPSTLFGIPEEVPKLRLAKDAQKAIEDDKRRREEHAIDDILKKRETATRTADYADEKPEDEVDLSEASVTQIEPPVEPPVEIVKPSAQILKKNWWYYLLISLLLAFILVSVYFLVRVFVKSNRLRELAIENPREFIKEVYLALCRALRLYGIPKFDYLAHREFYKYVKEFLLLNPEPLHLMTETVLEVRFSTHDISAEHSHRIMELFRKIKDDVLQREGLRELWRSILFRVVLLDILLLQRHLIP